MRAPQVVQNLVSSVVGAGAEGLLASPSPVVSSVLLAFLRLRRTRKMISPMIPMKGNAMITYANAKMIIGVDSDVDADGAVDADVDAAVVDVNAAVVVGLV